MRDTKQEVLNFWFEETKPQQWFQKSEAFDKHIKDRFETAYKMATEDLCTDWAKDAHGALALIIVLDQFPRNMFRDTPLAFATDHKALLIAKEAVHKGFDQILEPMKRRFIYLPFEHSENIEDQRQSVDFFKSMKEEDPVGYDYAVKHMEVIEKFGRFPHRNKILGRRSTQEEIEFLNHSESSF